jgi:DNA-binding beta-propeller fold protein YncE
VCLIIFSGKHFITDTFADDRYPLLTPLEDYRDFIPFGTDLLRPDMANDSGTGFTKLLFIDAVAARGNDIFVADTNQRMIFLIDRGQRSLSKFAPLTGGGSTDLYYASDFSLYVINQSRAQVIKYSRDGRIIRTFGGRRDLSNPVAVVESSELNRVLVADSLSAQVSMFNKLGGLTRVIGQNINFPSPASSIIDMASANGLIYLLDKLAREVSVANSEGKLLYTFGSSQLKQPVALAIDYCGRIFVADQFDNTIHVFVDEIPLTIFKNNHPGLTGFQLITDLWIDNELLYVADGLSGSIKLLRIEGGCR